MSIDETRRPAAECLSPDEAAGSFEAWPAAKRALLKRYADQQAAAHAAAAAAAAPQQSDWEAIEELRQNAKAEGFEQGLAEGRAQAARELAEHRARLEALLEHLHKPLASLDTSVEEQLVELTLEIGATLFRAQIDERPEQVREIVKEAVQMLPVATNDVSVCVHPDDAALLSGDTSAQAAWEIVEDISVQRGGCRVTTTSSDVDATVAGRLEALRDALLGGSH